MVIKETVLSNKQKENFAMQFNGKSNALLYFVLTLIPEAIIGWGLIEVFMYGAERATSGKLWITIAQVILVIVFEIVLYKIFNKYIKINSVDKRMFLGTSMRAMVIPKEDVIVEIADNKQEVFSKAKVKSVKYMLNDEIQTAEHITEETKEYLAFAPDSITIVRIGEAKWCVATALLNGGVWQEQDVMGRKN